MAVINIPRIHRWDRGLPGGTPVPTTITICTTLCAHRYISRVRSEQVLIFYVPGNVLQRVLSRQKLPNLYQVFPSVFGEDTHDHIYCRFGEAAGLAGNEIPVFYAIIHLPWRRPTPVLLATLPLRNATLSMPGRMLYVQLSRGTCTCAVRAARRRRAWQARSSPQRSS